MEEFVTGIGGIFFKSADAAASNAWHAKILGIDAGQWGKSFMWKDYETGKEDCMTQWSIFKQESDYFGNPNQQFMINYRVKNFEKMLEHFANNNIALVKEPEYLEYGKFAWINDPDGNRIELWEPAMAHF